MKEIREVYGREEKEMEEAVEEIGTIGDEAEKKGEYGGG